jgi:hypothetical protein
MNLSAIDLDDVACRSLFRFTFPYCAHHLYRQITPVVACIPLVDNVSANFQRLSQATILNRGRVVNHAKLSNTLDGAERLIDLKNALAKMFGALYVAFKFELRICENNGAKFTFAVADDHARVYTGYFAKPFFNRANKNLFTI